MKGTIFEKGNKIANKWHRLCAWARVKKYWLFMPAKDYKKSIWIYIVGAFTTLVFRIGIIYGLIYVVANNAKNIIDFVKGLFKRERKEES